MIVTGVRVELPSNTPLVLLQEAGSARFLPIWVGATEALAISSALEGVAPPRPQTHDLMASVLETLGVTVERVVVTALENNVFFAELYLRSEQGPFVVSSRPSDAIALAVRTGSPVFADPAVLDEAGIELGEGDVEESTIAEFRQALEDVTVEDFIDPESGL